MIKFSISKVCSTSAHFEGTGAIPRKPHSK